MTGFTFFQNYYDAISDEENELSEAEQGRLYNAIFAYMFRDEEPNLKGACKMAFNLIKPSLDRSKQNGKNKGKNGNGMETVSNQMETNGNEMEFQNPPFFENKEERNKNKEDICSDVHNACTREEGDEAEIVEGYLKFLKEHPAVVVDITNPSLIASVDYSLLSHKIAESKFLQTRQSLDWLINNYPKIISDAYKDYRRAPPKKRGVLEEMKEIYDSYDEGEKDGTDVFG